MPYSPEQLTAITVDAVTKASVFIARDPANGAMYVFCRLSMDRRPLLSPDAVMLARTQLGIPFLRGDDPATSQDIGSDLVALFAVNEDDQAATIKLETGDLSALVGQIAAAVADEESRRLQG